MVSVLSEMSNEIHDNGLHSGTGFNLVKSADTHGLGPYSVLLGVMVTLIPKLVPKIMPVFVRDQKARERFDDEDYVNNIQETFMQRFIDNLEFMEKMMLRWQESGLTFADLGLSQDNPLAKQEVQAGPVSDQLLNGIRFLKYRAERVDDKSDRITRMADMAWNVFNVTYKTVKEYLTNLSAKETQEMR